MTDLFNYNGATFDEEDPIFRYLLWRTLVDCDDPETILWIMLNPSTADAENDDPTIRRCLSFSKDWGYERVEIANLFALRATDPEELTTAPEIIGWDNDRFILEAAKRASRVMVAWGAFWKAEERAKHIMQILKVADAKPLCLGHTLCGAPRHPLYVRGGQKAIEYIPGRGARLAGQSHVTR